MRREVAATTHHAEADIAPLAAVAVTTRLAAEVEAVAAIAAVAEVEAVIAAAVAATRTE